MRKRHYSLPAVLLSLIAAASTGWGREVQVKENTAPLPEIKTLNLVVESKEKAQKVESLPFLENCQRLFGYAGIAVAEGDKQADAILRVVYEASVTVSFTLQNNQVQQKVTGAALKGTVSLLKDQNTLREVEFSGTTQGDHAFNKHFALLQGDPQLFVFFESVLPALVKMLGQWNKQEPLLLCLKDANDFVKEAGKEQLQTLKTPESEAFWLAALSGDDIGQMKLAVEALGKMKSQKAVEPLIAVFQGADYRLREAAARALAEIGDRRATPALAAGLSDKDKFVALEAASALAKLKDPQAVEALIAALPVFADNRQPVVARALGEIGDSRAVEPLIKALRTGDNSLKKEAAIALGELKDQRAVEALRETLKSDAWWVRDEAEKALVKITGQAPAPDAAPAAKPPVQPAAKPEATPAAPAQKALPSTQSEKSTQLESSTTPQQTVPKGAELLNPTIDDIQRVLELSMQGDLLDAVLCHFETALRGHYEARVNISANSAKDYKYRIFALKSGIFTEQISPEGYWMQSGATFSRSGHLVVPNAPEAFKMGLAFFIDEVVRDSPGQVSFKVHSNPDIKVDHAIARVLEEGKNYLSEFRDLPNSFSSADNPQLRKISSKRISDGFLSVVSYIDEVPCLLSNEVDLNALKQPEEQK